MNVLQQLSVDTYSSGVITIVILVILSVLFQQVMGRFFMKSIHDPEVIGGFFQVIGTLYAVILGLVVVDGMERFSNANDIIESEAKSLVRVYSLSERITTPGVAERIREKTRAYIDEVIANDWMIMRNNQENFKARRLLREVINEIKFMEPLSQGDAAVMPILLEDIYAAWGHRIDRVHHALDSIPGSEWTLLLVGGLITIFASFFFPLESQLAHSILTGLTSLMILMSLYAVLQFSEPFKGDFVVSKLPFLTAERILSGDYYGPEPTEF